MVGVKRSSVLVNLVDVHGKTMMLRDLPAFPAGLAVAFINSTKYKCALFFNIVLGR